MKQILVAFLVVILVGALAAARDFDSRSAREARSRYAKGLRDLKKQYVADLEKSRDTAMTKKDLKEANQIQAEIDHIKKDDGATGSGDISEDDVSGKTFLYNFVLRDGILVADRMTLKPDGTIEWAGQHVESFWRIDPKQGLVFLAPDKQKITSFYKTKFSTDAGRLFILGHRTTDARNHTLLEDSDDISIK